MKEGQPRSLAPPRRVLRADLGQLGSLAFAAAEGSKRHVYGEQALASRRLGDRFRLFDPADLAVTAMTALQGGLLLAQTTREIRPLELALDMAIAHAGRYRTG